jgi:tRNA threonylcarbamoyladenosine biosynthesis protein TsaE
LKLNDIPEFAAAFAQTLRGGEIIGLVGDLGAGKTTFVKALGKQLGIKKIIPSPTFILLQSFVGKLPNSKAQRMTLYHLDIYRLHSFQDVTHLGIQEWWGQPNTVTIIEWADKIKQHLPAKTIIITFI